MNWDLIFTITNNYALLMWLILAFAPRRTPIMTAIFYGGVGLLAGAYAVIVIPMMTGMIDGGWFSTCFYVSPGITRLRMPLYPNKTLELKIGGKYQSRHGKDLKKVR